ncbi:MAG: hypothetical protein GXP42_07675 [Chloroflexi bacterium]|nr:hypothetical protein [Chloroflexota bacterium]
MNTTTTKPTSKRTTKARRRGRSKPLGARALLAALALSGTLGGWAILANAAHNEPEPPITPTPTGETITISTGDAFLVLPPIPTVAPPPAEVNLTTPLNPLPEPVQLAPIPAVSRPAPQPMTHTRSSR